MMFKVKKIAISWMALIVGIGKDSQKGLELNIGGNYEGYGGVGHKHK